MHWFTLAKVEKWYTYIYDISLLPPAAIDWLSAKFALNPHPDLPSMRSASCLLTALFVCLMLLMAELMLCPTIF